MDVDMKIQYPDLAGDTPLTEVICYGAFCGAKAKLEDSKPMNTQASPWSRYFELELLLEKPQCGCLRLISRSTNSSDLGVLDSVTSKQLGFLQQLPGIQFSVVFSSDVKPRAKKTATIVDVSVNVLGPLGLADEVAEILDRQGGYLQHPVSLQTNTRYINPQYFYPNGMKHDLRQYIGPAPKRDTEKRMRRLQQELEDAIGSLAGSDLDWSYLSDDHLLCDLEIKTLRTQLKPHQVEALKFIRSRESQTVSRRIQRDLGILINYKNENSTSTGPCFWAGGILADAMGLGKTLTMLVTISSSLDTAKRSVDELSTPQGKVLTIKATLVVVTSKQLLDVWKTEADRHFLAGSLSVHTFHGPSRASSAQDLSQHDIVLTTYGTLMADCNAKGRKVLQQPFWFRVVLDEAHWIRNTSTRQFKAAASLKAERRWCITGTPIQNSLDDLQSLLRFLKIEPFDRAEVFQNYIVSPLRLDHSDAFRPLKLLLRAICLRRSSSLLNLRPAKVEIVRVPLSPQEREVYKGLQKQCGEEFEKITCQRSQLKKYTVLFSTITKLRRLCSHGMHESLLCKEPVQPKKRKRGKSPASSTADVACEYCGGDEELLSLLDGMDTCPECSRPLEDLNHLKPPTSNDGSLSPMHMGSRSPVSAVSSQPPSPFAPNAPAHQHMSSTPSSKLSAVVENIEMHRLESKSIVFASWQYTLDSLANLLAARRISYQQVDGRVPPAQREVKFASFKEDPSVSVLLISIQTGAVGLTLTVANRVHFVEPQWNPAVEEQAIARALRMGQTKQVTVIRYIVEKSVEETIAAMQKKKGYLARVTLDAAEHKGETMGLDDLKFVLDHDMPSTSVPDHEVPDHDMPDSL